MEDVPPPIFRTMKNKELAISKCNVDHRPST